jgi:hypothetical protein
VQAYIASREAETGVMMRWAEAQLPGEVPRLLAAMQTRAAGAALSALTLACATTNSERERERVRVRPLALVRLQASPATPYIPTAYSDAKVANRNAKVSHGATENGP